MGDVLNLDSYRKSTDLMWLSAYGFSVPAHWSVVDGTIGKIVEYQGVRAKTTLIGRHRGRGVCVLTMVEGRPNSVATSVDRLVAVLNAAVVRRVLTNGEVTWGRIVYGEGSAFDLHVTATDEKRLMSEAINHRRLSDQRVLTTIEIAPHLTRQSAALIRQHVVEEYDCTWGS